MRAGKTTTPFQDLKDHAESICERITGKSASDWEAEYWRRRVEAYRKGDIRKETIMPMGVFYTTCRYLGLDEDHYEIGRQRQNGGYTTVATYRPQFINAVRSVAEHTDNK